MAMKTKAIIVSRDNKKTTVNVDICAEIKCLQVELGQIEAEIAQKDTAPKALVARKEWINEVLQAYSMFL